tara:strand:+ start:2243 stop:3169 length:927 start_codon:yes stop_codon:yes gene_type:complete
MSIKNKMNKYNQCLYKKINGDYCKIHSKSKNIIRIDSVDINNDRDKYDTINIKFLQNKFRKKYISKISGPGYDNIQLIDNDRDILSHELLWIIKNNKKIPVCEFDRILLFSYKNKFGSIKGFNILSLKDMFNNNIYIDPYTNESMDKNLIDKINYKIKFLEKINYKHTNTETILTNQDKHKMRINEVFKKFDILGLFIDIRWFDKLDNNQIKLLYRETKSIWEAYKSDNPYDSKFIMDDTQSFKITKSTLYNTNDKIKLEQYIITEFDKLISNGQNDIAKKMGGYIVIGALAYVLPEVKLIYNDITFY